MRVFVRVKPNSKEVKVVPPAQRLLQTSEVSDYYTVCVKEPPVEGKANDAVIKALAMHFSIPRSRIALVAGATTKTKVFQII